MTIFYVASSRIPSERAYGYAVMKLCEEWGRAGHIVRLVIPDRKHGPQDEAFTYYGLERTFEIEKLPAGDLLGAGTMLSRFRFLFDIAGYALSLRRFRFSPDAVVFTRDYVLGLVLPKKNLFIEIHTVPRGKFLLRRALARARGIIAISAGVQNALVKLGIDKQKILVAHDGVDLGAFSAAKRDKEVWREFGIDPSRKIVLYTGHFYEWKGADTLAKAVPSLPKDVHVVLMGGIDEELAQFRKEYSGEHISILSHQPKTRIPLFVKSADVLVLPNSAKAEISRSHASPLKLFEYMASEVPIVASNVPSLREILTDEAAFFFDPDDEASLANTIGGVLEKGQTASKKAHFAYTQVHGYTWASRAGSIAAFLRTHVVL